MERWNTESCEKGKKTQGHLGIPSFQSSLFGWYVALTRIMRSQPN